MITNYDREDMVLWTNQMRAMIEREFLMSVNYGHFLLYIIIYEIKGLIYNDFDICMTILIRYFFSG
jgi:hypothetical protein